MCVQVADAFKSTGITVEWEWVPISSSGDSKITQ